MAAKKKTARVKSSTAAFDAASTDNEDGRYVLRLFVAGTTPGSVRAVENLRKICDENLEGRFDLEVIDVYQEPTLARDEQIIAVPTLVKKLPAPLRRVLGDLSDQERVLVGLDIKPQTDEKKPQSRKKKTAKRS